MNLKRTIERTREHSNELYSSWEVGNSVIRQCSINDKLCDALEDCLDEIESLKKEIKAMKATKEQKWDGMPG